ncbi:prolipoprotein diacylglyceryl transferase [Ancylobacter mangrovi]|uniref:Phosphatidylglycerol--prolipoprotein diacylglyceryl transferase n=1 Tax=Ancylobacter mangrovi TaxID=2972472 RepID=A0A9X2P884_9HYPH|nr:prolipoprotein diacylglyceryl transferase [Ancylobacter mangrovi]MCS0493826.1 prolipoprotein diacylglyceryl transferase [Ancylobacter mangrovi]MCS0501477.1 prolipoprotein diacylglyceryl transferase [Ancylobacter mangrovi]
MLFTPPLFALPFPNIDPILIEFGPFAIRWYALAYVGGLLIGWWLAKKLCASPALWGGKSPIEPEEFDDAIVWVAFGVILGGRIGYVLFYNLPYYAGHPLEALTVWHGGMSFHGGFMGSILAMYLFTRRRSLSFVSMLDIAASVVPVGLFLGRIANFINGELWGRPSDVPWAIVFPHGGPLPRHPSQLYEAGLEGLTIFIVLQIAIRMGALRRPGTVAGLFVLLYGCSRIFVEFFREPDPQLGYLAGGFVTMGMVLSLPMLALGGWLIWRARRRPALNAGQPA